MKRVILASQSAWRRQLLASMGIEFEVMPSNFDEQLDESRDAVTVAKELALGKALNVAKKHPDAYVIGADTFVVYKGKQIGKPASPAQALQTLKMLCGNTHQIVTGVAIISVNNNVHLVDASVADVSFGKHSDKELQAYVDTGDPMDKAGAYGIQSKGNFLVERITGDPNTVIGLPTMLLATMLEKAGITPTTAQTKEL